MKYILNEEYLKISISDDTVINIDYDETVYSKEEIEKMAMEIKDIVEDKLKEFLVDVKDSKNNQMDFAFKYASSTNIRGTNLEPAAYYKYLKIKDSDGASWMLD